MRLTEELTSILNSVPSGLCVYRLENGRIYPIFHNQAFYQVLGYSPENQQRLHGEVNYSGVHQADLEELKGKVEALTGGDGPLRHTCRVFHDKRGEYRWIHVEGSLVRQEDGTTLLYGVYSDITGQKELELEAASARERLDHLVNSLPGGFASCRIEGERIRLLFASDGVVALSGHSREEYEALVREDAMALIYPPDRPRVAAAAKTVVESGADMEVSGRLRHKNGRLTWIHMNGRRVAAGEGWADLSVVITGVSAEARLFQSISNETADGVYVIDQNSYDLLYVSEYKKLFAWGADCVGQKCYAALHGRQAPCPFCTLKTRPPDGEEHLLMVTGDGRSFSTRFREMDWNGIPAYVKYVRDITQEAHARKEKETLEAYFKSLVNNLPGGVAVVRHGKDGRMIPEFLSKGFAAMTGMTLEQAWELYQHDALAGVHPEDLADIKKHMPQLTSGREEHQELEYRLVKGDGSYIWVKNTMSLIMTEGEERYTYVVYRDITRDREEQEKLRGQYKDLLLQHYRTHGPDTLLLGHCNITQGRILELLDDTHLNLLGRFGHDRDGFFTGLSSFIVDREERQAFLDAYLSAPTLAYFARGEREREMECFVQIPGEAVGRYARFRMNLIEAPDSRDVMGILTVTDVTERTVSQRIFHHISATGCDYVADLDLIRDSYSVLSCTQSSSPAPPNHGVHSKWVEYMLANRVAPKDWEQYRKCLEAGAMRKRLETEGQYTFSFSFFDDNKEIVTKSMTVSPVDLRIGRVCLARSDITESVREQQGLLNMLAYTFDLMAHINVNTGRLTLYTRQTVLENLPPFVAKRCHGVMDCVIQPYTLLGNEEEVREQLRLDAILKRLEEKPGGYDFMFLCQAGEETRYKQLNILWGDENHRTVCLVRADVTDLISAERKSKQALEQALVLAREASQAKSHFLASMSHDIRTPMNAIMGMTSLAMSHMDDPARVADYLGKIAISSKHLLSLINDILDMSKIERAQLTLNQMRLSLPALLEEIRDIITPQAEGAGLAFHISTQVAHPDIYGDSLRMTQILLNLLGNAVKFTPEGGRVWLRTEEIPPVGEGERVRLRFTVADSGVGMSQEFLSRIFEPFSRGRGSARVEGTGLGLSITKGLVDLMGGTVSVESRPGKGSAFQVELEFEAAEDAAAPEKEGGQPGEPDQQGLAGWRFLVAEDNAINAEILEEVLKCQGAQCVLKPDGLQALRAFQSAAPGAYDGILMDIQMPEMNGYETARAIRRLDRPDAKEVPIIAMTANAFAEDVQAALEAGMNAHVAKPLNVGLLLETLRGLLPPP